MRRVLVLNATFEPIGVVSAHRAIVLVLDAKAELLHDTGNDICSERLRLPEPSVVRLSRYVHVPFQRRRSLNRRAVFARDGNQCQYCGRAAESLDHVIPRSRGGLHTWDNVVAACRRCNTRKRDDLLVDSGLTLRRAPKSPPRRAWFAAAAGTVPEHWEPYLEIPERQSA